MNTYVTKMRETSPPAPSLHVWSRHDVGQIALKAEMKFVPENLILTFGGYGLKMNTNGPFLIIITGLYQSCFESHRKEKEPTLVPKIPL